MRLLIQLKESPLQTSIPRSLSAQASLASSSGHSSGSLASVSSQGDASSKTTTSVITSKETS